MKRQANCKHFQHFGEEDIGGGGGSEAVSAVSSCTRGSGHGQAPSLKLILSLTAIAAITLLTGCATYHPKPLDPVLTEASFRDRSLSDPGLRDYLASQAAIVATTKEPILNLSTLTLIAFYYNPDLEAARASLDLASAGVVTAAAMPNPSVNFPPTYETPLPPGVTPWAFFGPSFDIPIETAGKRTYRIAEVRHLSRAAAFGFMSTAWQVRSHVRAAAVAYILAERMLELRRAEESARSELVTIFEKSFAAGEVSQPELITARSNLLDAHLAVQAAESTVVDARSALATALGVPLSAVEGAHIVWPELAHPPTDASIAPAAVQAAGLLNRLDVRGALADYSASESALQLEIAKQYPDIHLGPGYQFEQNTNKWTLGISLTLPVFNQNQGPIAEAEAKREQAEIRFAGLQARVIGDTARARALYKTAKASLADADTALSLARQQETAAGRLLQTGEGDRLSLVAAQIQRILAERGRLDALRRAQDALGALEDAVQRPLGGEPSLPPVPLPQSSLQYLEVEESRS
ncbi:MAG: TolC family protein [Magnetospirillum sp.]|nr:TolC family protein [Magnetospirillum sp.]